MASRLPCTALRALLVSHSFQALAYGTKLRLRASQLGCCIHSEPPSRRLPPTTAAAQAVTVTEQRGSRERESHDDRNVTRSIDSQFRIRDHGIDRSFRLTRRERCGGGYLLDEISPVIAAYAAIASRGHEDPSSLGPFRTEVHDLRPSECGEEEPNEEAAANSRRCIAQCDSGETFNRKRNEDPIAALDRAQCRNPPIGMRKSPNATNNSSSSELTVRSYFPCDSNLAFQPRRGDRSDPSR